MAQANERKRNTFHKKTSTSGTHTHVKFSSMNKNRRKSYKKYRGQGR